MSFFSEPLSFEFVQRAIWTAGVIGFTNGFLSGFVVLRRSALMMGALSHSLLPGIAVAVLLLGLTTATAFVGALVSALIVGLVALFIAKTSRIDSHTALAVLYTAAFAGGLLIIDWISTPTELEHWLFGNILALSDEDLFLSLAASGLILLTLAAFSRPLLLFLFEPTIAQSQGVPVRFLGYLLTGLVILGLVVSIQAVGCILSVAMLVAPAAAMLQFAKSPFALVWGGALLGSTISIAAVFVSYWLDLRVGAVIVLMLGGTVFVAYLTGIRNGAVRFLLNRPRSKQS
ncbi:MAG: metal ABC transporter permease [Verrucomicrobiota bacterium]